MHSPLLLAKSAASAAVDLIRRDYSEDPQVTSRADKDIKTNADIAVERLILNKLRPSGIPVLAEEGSHDGSKALELERSCWVIDPIDGTLNFTRGFKMAAVSIALWVEGQPVLGVVQDIYHGSIYAGEVGLGAWLDGQPIHVSKVTSRSDAILATGFPSGRRYDTESLLGFVTRVQEYKKIRMLGSAALMLAQVAAGRFDVYEEEDIYLWDVAAGLALVKAAGGRFSITPGSGDFKVNVLASNDSL